MLIQMRIENSTIGYIETACTAECPQTVQTVFETGWELIRGLTCTLLCRERDYVRRERFPMTIKAELSASFYIRNGLYQFYRKWY